MEREDKKRRRLRDRSKDVVLVNLDGPLELVHQDLGQELLDGNVVLLGPGDGDSRIDVVDFRAEKEGGMSGQSTRWQNS